MFRHYITSINYSKLIEMQAKQCRLNADKVTSKNLVSKQKNVKTYTKTMRGINNYRTK